MKFYIPKSQWLLIAGLVINGFAFGQQEQMYTHYDYNSLAMNPAYAGSKRTLVASQLTRIQWANYPGAPKYHNLAIHSPISNAPAFEDFAVGLTVQTGKIGKFEVASPFGETEISGNIAYHKQLTRDLRLAVGLRVGAFNYRAELSKLKLSKPGDIAFNNNDYSITAPMTGFGIYLYSDKFFASISSPRMVFISEDQRNGRNVEYATQMHYYAMGGVVLDVSDDVKLKPTTQIKFINGIPVQMDLNLHAFYKDFGSIGAFYRTGGRRYGWQSEGSYGIMTTIQINPSINVVYSYDSQFKNMNEYINGSHEFGLQFMIPYKENSRAKVPRYF